MRIESRRLVTAVVMVTCVLGSACLGGAPTEDEGAADTVAYKTLTLKAGHTVGWPNLQERYQGVSHVVRQDDRAVAVTSDLVVFGPVTKSIELDLDEPNWYWVAGSATALVVLHRPQGSADDVPWQSLRCGEDWQQVTNGFRFFFNGVSIDIGGHQVNGMDFSNCGIGASERPQFAVFVAGWSDPGSMVGDYDYTVWATCDSTWCTNERGLYPEARFADNPAPEVGTAQPLPQRAGPAETVRRYYDALGAGRIDEVVASWYGLDARAQRRLREIASNGRGYRWELPVANETMRDGGFSATVAVEVTATKGSTVYRWAGTIDLSLIVDLNAQTTSWKITAMRLAAR